jgi:hypothetical protein
MVIIFGLLAMLVILTLPGGLVLLLRAHLRFNRRAGVWRWLVLVGFIPLASTVFQLVADVRRDPASHNLWPFEVVFATAIGIIIMGAVLGLTALVLRVRLGRPGE